MFFEFCDKKRGGHVFWIAKTAQGVLVVKIFLNTLPIESILNDTIGAGDGSTKLKVVFQT